MSKKTDLSKQEQTLFREAMRGVKRIKSTKTPPEVKHPAPKKKRITHFEDTNELVQDQFSDFENLASVTTQAVISFSRPGVSNKTLRNLRNGKYNAEAILDLHGLTVDEARKSLSHFVIKCYEEGVRHILIIHGKGQAEKPVLKNKLNHWLRQTEYVLAFHSATRHGPSGALYALLKQPPINKVRLDSVKK